jgi:hypothetical protein
MTLEDIKVELTGHPDYRFHLKRDSKNTNSYIGWYKSKTQILLMIRVSKKVYLQIRSNSDTPVKGIVSNYETPITYLGEPMYIIDIMNDTV